MASNSNRANKSPIWVYFDIMQDDEKFVQCKLCFAKLSRGGIGKSASTTPMLHHIKKVHPFQHSLIERKRNENRDDLGSITTGCGPPILNLPHNHIPDMQAVAMARCRSVVVNSDDLYKECPVDVIPLTPEQVFSFQQELHVEDVEADVDTDSVKELHQNKSVLKPQNKAPSPKVSPPPKKSITPTSSTESEMCLRWNSHHANMQAVFPLLMDNEQYVDVSLTAEGKIIKCHKLILSSCSNYFDEMLKNTNPLQQPIIFLRGIEFWQIKALVDFMYKGEVNVDQNKLESLLKAAEDLQVKGLAGKSPQKEEENSATTSQVLNNSSVNEEIDEEEDLEKALKCESPMPIDENDEEYFPNPEYRRKYQGRKYRKRKISTPPDPSSLKHVKINLKGTKSRPNIKQPKFYSPDYPEYDPDRCVSPPKVDSDPIFHIDNVKLEPLDIDMPQSPVFEFSTIDTATDKQNLPNIINNQTTSASKETKVYARPIKNIVLKPSSDCKTEDNSSGDKQLLIEPLPSSPLKPIESEPSTSKETKDLTEIKCEPSTSKAVDIQPVQSESPKLETRKIILESNPDSGTGKKTIIVKCQNIQNLQKIIDAAAAKQNTGDGDATKMPPQIRVRNLPTTETMLKKFATTQLTSILKKGETIGPQQIILKKITGKNTTILRPILPTKTIEMKSEIVNVDDKDLIERIAQLTKATKDLNKSKTDEKSTEKPDDEEEIIPD